MANPLTHRHDWSPWTDWVQIPQTRIELRARACKALDCQVLNAENRPVTWIPAALRGQR